MYRKLKRFLCEEHTLKMWEFLAIALVAHHVSNWVNEPLKYMIQLFIYDLTN